MSSQNIPQDLKYTEEHEWVSIEEDDIVTVGITDYAQNELSDIVFVEFIVSNESKKFKVPHLFFLANSFFKSANRVLNFRNAKVAKFVFLAKSYSWNASQRKICPNWIKSSLSRQTSLLL